MNSHRPKVLLAVMEPPSNSSGLGVLWAKLSKGASKYIELDFIAPDLKSCFATPSNGIEVSGKIIEIKGPPLSRTASIKINSTNISILTKTFWFFIRAFFKAGEKLRLCSADEYFNWIIKEITTQLQSPHIIEHYDYYAVHVPSFDLAVNVYEAAKNLNKPLVLIIGDPQGWRTGSSFEPSNRELQAALFDYSSAIVMSKDTYYHCYRDHFKINERKLVFFSDSFIPLNANETELLSRSTICHWKKINLIHWGAIADYRDPSVLVEGIKVANERQHAHQFNFSVAGPIFSQKQRTLIKRSLDTVFQQLRPTSYQAARSLFENHHINVVLVSPRHLDNIPSKLVEGFAFKRPILLLANRKSAAAELIVQTKIGEVVTSDSAEDVASAIENLTQNYNDYQMNFNDSRILEFNADIVGNKFGLDLLSVFKTHNSK